MQSSLGIPTLCQNINEDITIVILLHSKLQDMPFYLRCLDAMNGDITLSAFNHVISEHGMKVRDICC